MTGHICYHTRLDANGKRRIVGGSFAGGINQETVERMVNAWFKVDVTPSGRAVFVDGAGRRVNLYFNIDPESTERGKEALAEYHRQQEIAQQTKRGKEEEVLRLLDGMTTDEALRRLRGE